MLVVVNKHWLDQAGREDPGISRRWMAEDVEEVVEEVVGWEDWQEELLVCIEGVSGVVGNWVVEVEEVVVTRSW